MGMYDNLIIDRIHLPARLQSDKDEKGWQTKDFDSELDTLIITKEGLLLKVRADWGDGERKETKEVVEYTGKMKFYKYVNNVFTKFFCEFECGRMLSIKEIVEDFE